MSEEEDKIENDESPDIDEELTATTEEEITNDESMEAEAIEEETEEVIAEPEETEAIEAETTEEAETIEEEEIIEEEIEVQEIEEEITEEEELEEQEEPIEVQEDIEEEFEIPDVPISVEEEAEEEIIEEELEIPDVPIEAEETTEAEEEFEAKIADEIEEEDEDTFEVKEEKKEPKRKKKKAKQALPFLLGLGIGLVVAVVAEILFSIPAWRTGTSRPDLYFAEMVVILIALMLPGLITRSIQRGLLGAVIIFVVSFGLPFLALLSTNVIILNPLTPLFSSTDFALDAYDVFQSLFNVGFDMESIQKWIWIIDLVLMFILMVIVVTIASALIKNITIPKKKAKHWVGIPFLALGLIIFTVFAPIAYSSTYGVIQASTAFLAGSSELNTAYGIFEGNVSELQTQDAQIQALLNSANYWFNISQANYEGLRNIGVINFAILVSGQYGPLIQTGDQLALATLSFTQVLYPLFNGIFELTDSFNDATNSMANFGQSESMFHLDNYASNLGVNNIDDLPQLKEDILSAVQGLENAQEALNTVLESLDSADVEDSFVEIEDAINEIDLEQMPERIAEIVQQIKDRISEYKGQVTGFIDFIGFANESLTPTKDTLLISYYTIVGNEYSKAYNFDLAYEAYDNASILIDNIADIPEFTPDPLLGDIFAVEITDGFNLLLNDLLALLDPLLDEQKSFAETYQNINILMQNFEAVGNEIDLVAYTPGATDPVTVAGEATKNFGLLAELEAQNFLANIGSGVYGSTYQTMAQDLGQVLTRDFKPQQFGDYTNDLANATKYFWDGCSDYASDNFVGATTNLGIADSIMQNVNSTLVPALTPDYFEFYLSYWTKALNDIYNSMVVNDSVPLKTTGIIEIDDNLTQLLTEIAVKS